MQLTISPTWDSSRFFRKSLLSIAVLINSFDLLSGERTKLTNILRQALENGSVQVIGMNYIKSFMVALSVGCQFAHYKATY